MIAYRDRLYNSEKWEALMKESFENCDCFDPAAKSKWKLFFWKIHESIYIYRGRTLYRGNSEDYFIIYEK